MTDLATFDWHERHARRFHIRITERTWSMNPLVIALAALTLAGAAHAQTATSDASPAAEAADAAQAAAESAVEKAAAVAEATAATGQEEQPAADAGEPATDMAAPAEAAEKAVVTTADDPAAPKPTVGEGAAKAPVTPPDVNPPQISEAEPGLLGSWVTSRRIWTTNQPSSTGWNQPETLEARPSEWQDIAKVNDIVLNDSGQVVGYIADIGGFLGIGAKKVLLGEDAIHMVTVGTDTFFATNYTKQELQALPDFDEKTVRK